MSGYSVPHTPRYMTAGAPTPPRLVGLPDEAAAVTRDWFDLRRLAATDEPAQPWSTGHSAEGKPERVSHAASSLRAGAPAGDVLFDRVARFWRSELHVDPDDGPLPDLVPLLEDGYGAQVIVARVAAGDRSRRRRVHHGRRPVHLRQCCPACRAAAVRARPRLRAPGARSRRRRRPPHRVEPQRPAGGRRQRLRRGAAGAGARRAALVRAPIDPALGATGGCPRSRQRLRHQRLGGAVPFPAPQAGCRASNSPCCAPTWSATSGNCCRARPSWAGSETRSPT